MMKRMKRKMKKMKKMKQFQVGLETDGKSAAGNPIREGGRGETLPTNTDGRGIPDGDKAAMTLGPGHSSPQCPPTA